MTTNGKPKRQLAWVYDLNKCSTVCADHMIVVLMLIQVLIPSCSVLEPQLSAKTTLPE